MREAMCELVLKKTDAVQKFVCDFNVKTYLENVDIKDDLVIKTPNEILHLNMDAIKYVFVKGLLGDPMAVLVSISQKGGKLTNVFMSDAMSTSLTAAWEVARKGRHIGLLKAFDNNGAFLLNMKDIIYISSHSLRCLEMKPVVSDEKRNCAAVGMQVKSVSKSDMEIRISSTGAGGSYAKGAGVGASGYIPKINIAMNAVSISREEICSFAEANRSVLFFENARRMLGRVGEMVDIVNKYPDYVSVDHVKDIKNIFNACMTNADCREILPALVFAERWRNSTFVAKFVKEEAAELLKTVDAADLPTDVGSTVVRLKRTLKQIMSRYSLPNVADAEIPMDTTPYPASDTSKICDIERFIRTWDGLLGIPEETLERAREYLEMVPTLTSLLDSTQVYVKERLTRIIELGQLSSENQQLKAIFEFIDNMRPCVVITEEDLKIVDRHIERLRTISFENGVFKNSILEELRNIALKNRNVSAEPYPPSNAGKNSDPEMDGTPTTETDESGDSTPACTEETAEPHTDPLQLGYTEFCATALANSLQKSATINDDVKLQADLTEIASLVKETNRIDDLEEAGILDRVQAYKLKKYMDAYREESDINNKFVITQLDKVGRIANKPFDVAKSLRDLETILDKHKKYGTSWIKTDESKLMIGVADQFILKHDKDIDPKLYCRFVQLARSANRKTSAKANKQSASKVSVIQTYNRSVPVAKGTQDLIDTGKSYPRLGIVGKEPAGPRIYAYHECTCGNNGFDYISKTTKRIECEKCHKLLTVDIEREQNDGNNTKAIVYTNYYIPWTGDVK